MNRIIFIGKVGTDAGGWYIDKDGHFHRIPGWNPEQMKDVTHALAALRELSQMKVSGIERTVTALREVVIKELGAHVKEGDMVVLG